MIRGLRTTEFWTTVVAVASVFSGILPEWVAAVAIGGYQISRGLAKAGALGNRVGDFIRGGPDVKTTIR